MNATASLDSELETLQAQVRRDASSGKLRVHLFQLLCVRGDWQRALAQLQVCAQLDIAALPMAQTYREAIRCEMFRVEVFSGKRTPQIMGTPPSWMGSLIEALKYDATGDYAMAATLRAKAMDEAQPASCTVDGVACEWIADGDSRLGPVCEVIANGQYYWLPFESCLGIVTEAPTDLRDLVWGPADLLLPNDGRVPALIPTRYAGTTDSNAAGSDALKMSRSTEWQEKSPDMWFGLGQRLWTSDVGDHPMLDTRAISMTATVATPT